MKSERVLVAMSGGVDSSVAAGLLVEKGYDVIGVTMKLFCYSGEMPDRACCSIDAIRDAEAVAEKLGIPHYVLDLSDSFERDVIVDFVSEYEQGRTPIPCVRCNSHTKFKDLIAYADDLNCRYVATGHYAIVQDGSLYKGSDSEKDQTYFLWGIDQSVLNRLLLPLGELTKAETRRLARQSGFGNAERAESVEICFVPDDDYMALLRRYLPDDSPALQRGTIETSDGTTVGEHEGYAGYTIGQRRGLPGGFPEAMYVTSVDPNTRTVTIGTAGELSGNLVKLGDVNWLASPLESGDACLVSTRYRSRLVPGRVSDADCERLTLELSESVRAITAGQSGVLYDESGRLLGGGIIQ